MKGGIGAASVAALGAGAAVPAALSTASILGTADTAQAQQAFPCATPWDLTQPATGILMQPGYARTIAQMAYVWGWPIVNMINRQARIGAGAAPGPPQRGAPRRPTRPSWNAA